MSQVRASRSPLVALVSVAFIALLLQAMLTPSISSGASRNTSPILSQFAVPGSAPRGLAWDGSNLWLVDTSKMVYRLNTTGGIVSSFPITFGATGMTWDGASLWIGDETNGRMVQVSTTGSVLSTLNVWYWSNSGLAWDGMAFWIGNYNLSQIHKHSETGAPLLSWPIPNNSGIEHPTGLAFDGTNLWIGDSKEGAQNNVARVNTSGQLIDTFDTTAWGIPPVTYPEFKSLAWDGQHLWYTADDLSYVYEIAVNSSGATATATATATDATPTATSTPVKGYLSVLVKQGAPTSTPTPTITPQPGGNHAPAFPSPCKIDTSTTNQYDGSGRLIGATTSITVCAATDLDGDVLTYSWSATNGTIVGNGRSATWQRLLENGRIQGGSATVTATDGRGGTATFKITFS